MGATQGLRALAFALVLAVAVPTARTRELAGQADPVRVYCIEDDSPLESLGNGNKVASQPMEGNFITPVQGGSQTRKKASLPRVDGTTSYSVYWPGIDAFSPPLSYGGGPIMSQPINVYLLFYGNWSETSGANILNAFVQSISNPAPNSLGNSVYLWWQIMSHYVTPSGTSVSTSVRLIADIFLGGNYLKHLRDGFLPGDPNDVLAVINSMVGRTTIQPTKNDIYVLMTSSDITVGTSTAGFCTGYCGYHYYGAVKGVVTQYAFVGDASKQCQRGCSPSTMFSKYLARTPNGLRNIDFMVSVLGHELAETASDPFPNTGFCSRKQENGDLCTGNFQGWRYQNGALFNLYGINGYRFIVQSLPGIIQQNCVLQSAPRI